MDEFPGNSQRAVNKPATPAEEPVKFEPVITGKVIKRKKPLGKRFMETFFKGDGGGVISYLFRDVLVPALQDMATDMVKQGIERAVYGEVRSPRSTRGSVGRTHISYDRYAAPSPARSVSPPAPPRRPATHAPSSELDEIILESKIAAEVIADKMMECLAGYEVVSVANLNELLGQTPSFTDNAWGWTNLDAMDIKRVREGWLLILPEPVSIR